MSVSDAQYQGWADDLADLDQQIEDLQKAKKDFYATVRDEHGKKTADALKSAIKIARMDSEKRSAAEEVEAEAFRILQIIQGPRAPRATRARENIEEFPSQPSPKAGSNLTVTASPEPLVDSQVAPIQPETANDTQATTPPPEDQGQRAVESVAQVHRPAEENGLVKGPSEAEGSGGVQDECAIHPATHSETGKPVEASASAAPEPITYPAPGIVVMETTPPEGALAHPYAACWPMRDIDVSGGVREPIVKIGKLILDGRGRMFAARGVNGGKGIAYPVVQYDGTDPLMDCIRWNMASRPNLHPHNLKIIAQKLAKEAPDRADEIHAAMGLVDEVAA